MVAWPRAMSETSRPIAAVVLAAGKGTRMKSARHKVLHEVAGRPMIEHLLASLAGLEPEQTVVVVGDGRDQLEKQLAGRAILVVQEPQLGTGHAVLQAQEALAGFAGDVLVLYADVPFVRAETMRAMIDRLHVESDSADIVVLAFEPEDTLQYGRVIANGDRVSWMVEHKDASEKERACRLCNSGLMAVRSELLFDLLAQVGNDKVICGLSGGVDSAVAALLVYRAIGDQLTCVYVDHGPRRTRHNDQAHQRSRCRPGGACSWRLAGGPPRPGHGRWGQPDRARDGVLRLGHPARPRRHGRAERGVRARRERRRRRDDPRVLPYRGRGDRRGRLGRSVRAAAARNQAGEGGQGRQLRRGQERRTG